MEAITLTNPNIRIDNATKLGSVIDVIQLVIPHIDSRHAGETLKRLVASTDQIRDQLSASIKYIRINGKGRETPCAPAATLVEIV
jgi:hypothetical protein